MTSSGMKTHGEKLFIFAYRKFTTTQLTGSRIQTVTNFTIKKI